MKKGAHHSEETRRRMAESHRGKKLSPEHRAAQKAGITRPEVRQHMSEVRTGRPLSPEHAAAVVASQRTPEARAAMSERIRQLHATDPDFHERQIAGTLAAQAKPEYRAKMSASIRKLHESAEFRARHKAAMERPETRERIAATRRGKSASEETKAKLRIANAAGARKRWARISTEKRRLHTTAATEASLALRAETSIERQIKAWLTEHDIAFEQQYRIGWYHVDFYVAALNLVIEANGCYWHSCTACGWDYPKRAAFDARKEAYLTRHGYALTVLWEHDLKRGDFSVLAAVLGIE